MRNLLELHRVDSPLNEPRKAVVNVRTIENDCRSYTVEPGDGRRYTVRVYGHPRLIMAWAGDADELYNSVPAGRVAQLFEVAPYMSGRAQFAEMPVEKHILNTHVYRVSRYLAGLATDNDYWTIAPPSELVGHTQLRG